MTIGYYHTPFRYCLSDTKFYIKRPGRLIRIDIKTIKDIREFINDDKLELNRQFGSEGVLGNFGRYSSKKHKRLEFITSRDTNWVLIELYDGKKYVISPDNIEIIEKTKAIMIKNNYV